MASKRELTLATAFFATLALLAVVFLRPLDPVEWGCLVISLAFVALGGVTLWKGEALAVRGSGPWTIGRRDQQTAAATPPGRIDLEEDVGKPSLAEESVLATTLAALVNAEALAAGEVEASLLWRAAQHADPGQPVGFLEALHSLATLHDLGRFAPRRLVFVPVQVEYDAALLASITASVLAALGHDVGAGEVCVALPRDGSQGRATIAFPLGGRRETITCGFLWKYPPPELFRTLAHFIRADDPRELVCADVDYGTLLLAAIRPGYLGKLNRRFPIGYDVFGAP